MTEVRSQMTEVRSQMTDDRIFQFGSRKKMAVIGYLLFVIRPLPCAVMKDFKSFSKNAGFAAFNLDGSVKSRI
jgi:hypothetical protein